MEYRQMKAEKPTLMVWLNSCLGSAFRLQAVPLPIRLKAELQTGNLWHLFCWKLALWSAMVMVTFDLRQEGAKCV
jgi:hypothetical protein